MKLVVRPWTEADAPALGRAIADSIDHLRPWMPWISEEPRGEDERRAWIREQRDIARAGGDEVFGIFVDDVVVGACGLHRRIGPGGLEIGYWVHADHTRRGIATAAVRQLCAMAFARPGIDRVEIHHDPANAASGGVAAAAGFHPVAGRDANGHRVWRLERQGAA